MFWIPKGCNYIIWHCKKDFVDVINLRSWHGKSILDFPLMIRVFMWERGRFKVRGSEKGMWCRRLSLKERESWESLLALKMKNGAWSKERRQPTSPLGPPEARQTSSLILIWVLEPQEYGFLLFSATNMWYSWLWNNAEVGVPKSKTHIWLLTSAKVLTA